MVLVKLIALLLALLIAASPAAAASCRQIHGHRVCILSIKRSAQRHWEYRAAVSVDGVAEAIEKYDCRDRVRIPKRSAPIPFEPDGVGDWICSFFPSR